MKRVLRRFSIALKEGVEVFVYEPRKSGDPISNPQLLAAFIENMHSSSEATDSFQQIRFSNRMYYAKQHELFTSEVIQKHVYAQVELV